MMIKTRRTISAAIGLVAMLLVPAAALAQRQTETVDRTLPFPSNGTLRLKNFSGEVRITAGSGRDFVMKAVRTGRADRLKEVRLTVETSGSTIEVNANERDRDDDRRWRDEDGNNNVVDTRFDIQVPASARLEIEAFSSDLIITGITGEQRLKTFSGDIESTGSRNPFEAETFSGTIQVDATGHGTSPTLSLETFSGEMRVRVAENARGEVALSTFSGALNVDFPVTLRSTSRRNIRADLPGGAGRTLAFKSFSGNLRLTK